MRVIMCFTIGVLLSGMPVQESAAAEDQSGDRLSFGIDLGARWEDNINLAGDDVDVEYVGSGPEFDDWTTSLTGSVSYAFIQSSGAELTGSLSAFYNDVNDIDGLSNWGGTAGLSFRGEFGAAFTDPWYSVSVDYTTAEFDDSRIRDGDWISAEAMVGKRFNPKFGMSAGARYLTRDQDNSTGLCPNRSNPDCPGNWREYEVFDQDRWGLFLHADWFITDRTSLFAEFSYWDGEEDATLPLRNGNGGGGRFPGWLNGQDIFADDPVFGRASFRNAGNGNISTADYIVWRVEAEQHVWEAGLRQALTDTIALEVVAIYMTTGDVESVDRTSRPKSVGDYSNTAVMASVSFTF